MRSILIITAILLTSVSGSAAQQAMHTDLLKKYQESGDDGNVKIEADSLLVANYYKLLNQKSKVQGVPGYRIRIFSQSGLGAKEQQQRVRARFLSLFPDVDAYYRYDEPYFKVYVGDCRTRSEALRLYDRIRKEFPNPILIPDNITIQ